MARANPKRLPSHSPNTVRASVTFPRELYETLEQIAHDKKVSVAWVVREAAETYVADRWPLLDRRQG